MTDPTPAELGQRHADEVAESKLAALATEISAALRLAQRQKVRAEDIEYLTAKAARLEKLARALRGEKR